MSDYLHTDWMTTVCTLVGGPYDGRASRISVMNTRGVLIEGCQYERVGDLLLYTGREAGR